LECSYLTCTNGFRLETAFRGYYDRCWDVCMILMDLDLLLIALVDQQNLFIFSRVLVWIPDVFLLL